MRRLTGTLLLCLAIACGPARSSGPPPSEPRTPSGPPIVAAAKPGAEASATRETTSTEVFIGAVGHLPVRASLALTPSHLEGRWVYEGRGSADGLALESTRSSRDGQYDVREVTAAGTTSGHLFLHQVGSGLQGAWNAPGGDRSLPVVLTRAVRAREGDNVIRARRIMVKHAGPPVTAVPAFLPIVEGPAASRMEPKLTLEKLTGDDERELGDGTTGIDFDVVHHDARLVTISTTVQTMGAYPSAHGRTVSLAWATGARVDAKALRPEKKRELVRLLDERVHAAWSAKKRELAKGPTDETSCGPAVIDGFMHGDGPSFTDEMLDSIYVDARGIAFAFDFGFPHVVQACSPSVDLGIAWDASHPYLDPAGVLRR